MGNTLFFFFFFIFLSFFCLIRAHFGCSHSRFLVIFLSPSFPSFLIANSSEQTICKHGVCDTSWKQHHQITCILFSVYIKSISHMLTFKIYNCRIDFMRYILYLWVCVSASHLCEVFQKWTKQKKKKNEIKHEQNVSRTIRDRSSCDEAEMRNRKRMCSVHVI